MEGLITAIPSAYTKFRICENPRNPTSLPGFWPPLFDYRGSRGLAEVDSLVGGTKAYESISAILRDAYLYYNVGSISIKKRAFFETSGGIFYDLSDYTVPRSHCTVNDGARVRIDQPRFKIEETSNEVKISFHDKYLELLPMPLSGEVTDGEEQEQDMEEGESTEDMDDLSGLGTLFDEESFSQQFDSQVSMFDNSEEEEDITNSPAGKKMRLMTEVMSTAAPAGPTSGQSKNCPLCGVYIGSKQSNVERHISKSCPMAKDIDPLEAARRRKRADRNKNQTLPFYDVKKEESRSKVEQGGDDHLEGEGEEFRGGDCGCRGVQHGHECLRLRGGAAHARLPRHNQQPHLIPDPDFLPPRLLRPIIPIIQALDQNKLTNRQNRWVAGGGPPRLNVYLNNNLWLRVVNKIQLPFLFSDSEFLDLFYLNKQQMFQLRNAIIYPMLAQRVAQAQGRGTRGLPHTLTPDSLACLFMLKMRLGHTDRAVAAQLGISQSNTLKWLKIVRDFYFTNDPYIGRNLNLGIRANLQAILRQGIEATARCQRTSALYGPLCLPGTELLVVAIDSRAVKIQHSTDAYLQKRTISTKINDNSVQKMTISDVEGIPMITFPLMCAISPAGTDESNCEYLIRLQEAQVAAAGGLPAGGFLTFLESPLTEPVTIILLQDQGFRKFGFDRAIRRSFTDYEDDLEVRTNGGFRYFTPCFPSDPFRDQNFNPVGQYGAGQLPGGSRHRSRTANTSTAGCTKTRWAVEVLFSRERHLSLLGAKAEVPNQYLEPCGIPNYGSLSHLMVWLLIGDSINYHYGTPYNYKYPTVDTYLDHGNDIRQRIELETPLSSLSGIVWSRDDIFSRPMGMRPVTRHNQPILRVDLFDPQQTGMPPISLAEFSSVTLGSYQKKLVRTYLTSLR